DQYWKERLLVIALAIFLLGCVGAATAWNIWSLIAFRAVQGAGGAVFPLSFGIIRDEFPREKLGLGIGLISAVFGVGGGFGTVLSGLIVDHASWRWLFIVGAVPIAVTVLLVHRFVPESPIKTPSQVDVLGASLLSVGLVALLLALTEGENWAWTSGRARSRCYSPVPSRVSSAAGPGRSGRSRSACSSSPPRRDRSRCGTTGPGKCSPRCRFSAPGSASPMLRWQR